MIVCLTPSKSDTGFGLSFLTASKAFSSLREEKNTSAANTSKMATSKSRATAPPLAPISTCLTHFASFITTLLLVLILSHLTPTTEAAQPEVRIKAVTYDWLCVLDINCTHHQPVHLKWKGYDYKTNHLSIKANSDMSEEPVVCSTNNHPRETVTVDIRDHCKFPPTVRYMLKKVLPIYFTFLSGVILCLVFPAARYPSLLSALPVAMASTTSSITTDVSTLSNYSSQQSTTEHPTTANSQPYTAVEKTLLALIPILIACIVMVLVFTFLLKKKQKEVNDAGVYPIYRPRRSSSMSKLTLITTLCLLATANCEDHYKVAVEGENVSLENKFFNNRCELKWLWFYSRNEGYLLANRDGDHTRTFDLTPKNMYIDEDNFDLFIKQIEMKNSGRYELQYNCDSYASSEYYVVTVLPNIAESSITVESVSLNNSICQISLRCGIENDLVKTSIKYEDNVVPTNNIMLSLNISKEPSTLSCFTNTSKQSVKLSLNISDYCREDVKDFKHDKLAKSDESAGDEKKQVIVFSVIATIAFLMVIVVIISFKPKLCFGTPVYAVVLAATGAEASNCTCADVKNDWSYVLVVILATLTCVSLIVGILKIIFLCLFRCPGKHFDDDDV